MSVDNAAITPAPAPWRCRATVYTAVFWVSPSQTADPAFAEAAYDPLERAAPFGAGKPEGGVGSIMLIRYRDTPVGPYDEMMLLPGKFGYEVDAPSAGAGKRSKKSKLRITRIYVSQRNTTWNGRTNWNIPKHLARFDFTEHADGSAECKVFPLAGGGAGAPVFQARFVPSPYVPPLPVSTRAAGWLVDLELAQPPLPAGATEATPEILAAARAQGEEPHTSEVAGTQRWCAATPYQYSSGCRVGWMDLRQADGGNFLPGASRWAVAVKMPDTDLRLGEAVWWDEPRSRS
ncbi:hypothetical protein CC85DRAFT_298922 [Cutaneotrichosporon oleaginosum]|uniref:Acetoacetate decarboxylase n=1 Tax=Cutaneotrichosporon oleaginosum TaxID=879819 RepID=A0A0J0XYX6_9TREE|nr:uncharacterized protein CC85DRAFT_298922 [Cutaneotrichosporon oleaginosum]KLT46231.1 hypothetical protein CC85DRAFT_298922 [Cutaneotrichosporon oleaginosum]TXT10237.1 hypothetical protein COLE_04171 [Cutaneotrichosporon oleaginosum]